MSLKFMSLRFCLISIDTIGAMDTMVSIDTMDIIVSIVVKLVILKNATLEHLFKIFGYYWFLNS